jgi:hypothetical protein
VCAGAKKCSTKRSRWKRFSPTLILCARSDPAPVLSTRSPPRRASNTTTGLTMSLQGLWLDHHSVSAGANKCSTKRSRWKSFGLTLILCVPVRINAVRNEELCTDPHSLCAGANECNTKRSRSKGFDLTLILRARPDPAPMLSTRSASV